MISIKNLQFKYRNREIFNGLNMEFEDKKITSIIGTNGSGKSTLVKILAGLYCYDGEIIIDNLFLKKENQKKIQKKIGFVFTIPDDQFVAETVMDELAFTLENINYKNETIRRKIKEIAEQLKIENLLELNPHNLNSSQKQLVCLASTLIYNPKILILDDSLSLLDFNDKKNMLDVLKKLNARGLTIINISHDIEETLISDKIYVLDNGKVVLEGNKDEVYKEEKKLHNLGFDLPFMVELSNRLIFYDLINEPIYDMEKMVDILWK